MHLKIIELGRRWAHLPSQHDHQTLAIAPEFYRAAFSSNWLQALVSKAFVFVNCPSMVNSPSFESSHYFFCINGLAIALVIT